MRKKFTPSNVIMLICMPLFISCASLPKATVDMSLLLDKQLTILEQNHITIINKYFEEKQYHVLSFLDNEWYPDYLENFFNDEEVEDIWNEIINNPDRKEQIADLRDVVTIIQAEYMKMRETLLSLLEVARRELLTAVQIEYNMAKTMNNTILNNVASVSDIQEARKEYLSRYMDTNAIDNKMNTYLEQADKILDNVREGIDKYNDTADKIDSMIDKLK